MNSTRQVSLDQLLSRLLFFQLLVPLTFVSVLATGLIGHYSISTVQTQQFQVAKIIADQTYHHLDDANRVLLTQGLMAAAAPQATLVESLSAIRATYPYFSELYLVSAAGEPEIKLTSAGQVEPDFHNLVRNIAPVSDQQSNNPALVTQIVANQPATFLVLPLLDGRYIVGCLDFNALQTEIQLDLDSNSQIFLIDENSNLLVQSGKPVGWQLYSLAGLPVLNQHIDQPAIYYRFGGTWMTGSEYYMAETGWSVVVQQPLSTAVLPVLGFFGLVLLVIMVGWIVMVINLRRQANLQVAQPLGQLSRQAQTLSINPQIANPREATVPASAFTELQTLVGSFTSMNSVIQERQTALAESAELYRKIIETSPDAIVMCDLAGTVQLCNNQACLLFNYSSANDILGAKITRLLPRQSLVMIDELAGQVLQHGFIQDVELQLRRQGGAIFTGQLNAAVVRDSSSAPRAYLGVVRDISENKRREQFLAGLNQITSQALLANSTPEILQYLADQLANLFDADDCYITLLERDTGLVRPMTAHGALRNTYAAYGALPVRGTLTELALKARKPLVIPDIKVETAIKPDLLVTFPNTSILGMPLIAGQQELGAALVGFRKPRKFSPDEISWAEQVARQFSLAVAKTILIESTQRQLEEISLLHAVTLAANNATDEVDLILRTTQLIGEAMRLETLSAWRLEPSRQQAVLLAAYPNSSIFQEPKLRIQPESSLWAACESRQLVRVDDGSSAENFQPVLLGAFSQLVIPIVVDASPIGLIIAESARPHAYGAELERVMLTVSSQVDAALARLSLYQQERQRRQEAELLQQATASLTSSLEVNQVLETILDYIAGVVPLDSASVFMEQNNALRVMATRGFQNPGIFINQLFELEPDGLFDTIRKTRQVLILEDASQDARFKGWGDTSWVRGWIGVPLLSHGTVIGYLTIDSLVKNCYTSNHAKLAQAFANQASAALENARLFEANQVALQRANSLYRLSRSLISTQQLVDVLHVIVTGLVSALPAQRAAAVVFDLPTRTILQFADSADVTAGPAGVDFSEFMAGSVGRVVQTGKPVLVTKAQAAGSDLNHWYSRWRDGQSGSKLITPLSARGATIGALLAYNLTDGRDFTEADLDLLNAIANQSATAIDNRALLENLRLSNQELSLAYDATIEGWSRALELRDHETLGHTLRVSELTQALANSLGIQGEALLHIRRGTLLHDIGKMGVPDAILFKPGALSEAEWREMRKHPGYAHDMLAPIAYLAPAMEIPYCHHEKWDGSGYPRGLRGEGIPLSARIFSVVDVYDALTNQRPYRQAWSQEQALAYLLEHSGSAFDPRIVQAFIHLIQSQPALPTLVKERKEDDNGRARTGSPGKESQ